MNLIGQEEQVETHYTETKLEYFKVLHYHDCYFVLV